MRKLESQIRSAISQEGWQVVEGVEEGETLQIDPSAKPNPKILIRQILSDGTPVIAVWAYIKSIRSATLITVYFEWNEKGR